MLKLEIPTEKAPEFEFYYGTEGPIELSQLSVKKKEAIRFYVFNFVFRP